MWKIKHADGFVRNVYSKEELRRYVRGPRVSAITAVIRADGTDGWVDAFPGWE